MRSFLGCPKAPYIDAENSSGLTATCQFPERRNFSDGIGNFNAGERRVIAVPAQSTPDRSNF